MNEQLFSETKKLIENEKKNRSTELKNLNFITELTKMEILGSNRVIESIDILLKYSSSVTG